jgi:transposase-like protein
MRKERRRFSNEFKKQLLAEAERGTPITELASQHDLTVTMICRWKRQMREGEIDQAAERAPRASSSDTGVDQRYVRELEMKLREANEKLGEMYIVVEGLKKVRGDFQRTRNASSFVATASTLARLKRPAK